MKSSKLANRSTATAILFANVVVVAALSGLYGYEAYWNHRLTATYAVALSKIALAPVSPRPLDLPIISESLSTTPSGIHSTIKIDNKTPNTFDQLRLTDVDYNDQSVKGLPISFRNVAPHTVTRVDIPVPALKTTRADSVGILCEYTLGDVNGVMTYHSRIGTQAQAKHIGYVDVEICEDTHDLATMYCPETVIRTLEKGLQPTNHCRKHQP